MPKTKMRPAPLATGTGLGMLSTTERSPEITASLPRFQAEFVAARFRLDGPRARLTAELCWGRP